MIACAIIPQLGNVARERSSSLRVAFTTSPNPAHAPHEPSRGCSADREKVLITLDASDQCDGGMFGLYGLGSRTEYK